MKQSQYFFKTSKTKPSEDISQNAILLEQAGYIKKMMAGVYAYLPMGLRVLSKIENIVREEMNKVAGQEIFMPSLHPKENWLATKRWSELDVLFKVKSQHGYEYALGPTHEEIVTPLAQQVINSYKDLPLSVYQLQTKFRDEPRAKSGLLRGREFRMKDLYSFHRTSEDLDRYYTKIMIPAYDKVFKRLGLDALLTEASGGTFSKFSHEYQVEIENGEDVIYICEKCRLAKNKEIFEVSSECTNCGHTNWKEVKASEVGNIFKLETKYSSSFNLNFTDEDGKQKPVIMGCYGIGTSRLMGVIVEKYNDKKGILWPEVVAPFKIHLIGLNLDKPEVKEGVEKLYAQLLDSNIEVLYDDRESGAGAKFADSDLIGIPYRVVVSSKTLAEESVEVKLRSSTEAKLVNLKDLVTFISSSTK